MDLAQKLDRNWYFFTFFGDFMNPQGLELVSLNFYLANDSTTFNNYNNYLMPFRGHSSDNYPESAQYELLQGRSPKLLRHPSDTNCRAPLQVLFSAKGMMQCING